MKSVGSKDGTLFMPICTWEAFGKLGRSRSVTHKFSPRVGLTSLSVTNPNGTWQQTSKRWAGGDRVNLLRGQRPWRNAFLLGCGPKKPLEVNAALDVEAELVNSYPYGDGMVKIEISDHVALGKLMSAEDYQNSISV